MTAEPPPLRLADGRGMTRGKMLATAMPLAAVVLLLDDDAPAWGHVAAPLAFLVAVWVAVAFWRQHVTLHARGLTTRRAVRRETTQWHDMRAVTLKHSVTRDGSGWAYAASLHDARTVPHAIFGEILLRPVDRDRMARWIRTYVPEVDVAIDAGWPRGASRAWAGRYRISVEAEDAQFVAVVRLGDGAEVERGPFRPTAESAIADGSAMLLRYLDLT